MSALNFPDNPADVGNVYVGDNGITYDYINGKWRGRTAAGTGGGTTSTVWTNNANGCLRAELSSTGFQAFTDATHLDLQDGGIWSVGSYQNSTFIGNDEFTNTNILSLRSGDETYITTNLRENGNYQWKFGADGTITLPSSSNVLYTTTNALIKSISDIQISAGDDVGSNWIFGGDGEFTLPSGGRLGYAGKGWTGLDGGLGMPVSLTSLYPSGMYSGCVTIGPGNGVQLSTYGDGTGQTGSWEFNNAGYIQIQNDARIATSSTVVCPINADTVIYTSTNEWQMTFKLLIKVEGFETTDTVPWDTQSTEMIIARSFRNNQVVASVYGVVHTSTNPLATFTAQWNAVTNRVEVLCRPTSSTYPVQVRTLATEITSSD